MYFHVIGIALRMPNALLGTSKNQFRWFFEVPCGEFSIIGCASDSRVVLSSGIF